MSTLYNIQHSYTNHVGCGVYKYNSSFNVKTNNLKRLLCHCFVHLTEIIFKLRFSFVSRAGLVREPRDFVSSLPSCQCEFTMIFFSPKQNSLYRYVPGFYLCLSFHRGTQSYYYAYNKSLCFELYHANRQCFLTRGNVKLRDIKLFRCSE